MTFIEILLLGVSGIFMGIVAVTAGGGATVGVPFLLLLGHPASVSIVAVKFALVGSFITGTLAYGRKNQPAVKLPFHIWPLSVVGAILGANLVLNIAPDVLRLVILVLLVVVLILSFTLKPSKTHEHSTTSRTKRVVGTVVIFGLCVYSGFFGAGFGSFLIFALMYFYGYSYLESASVGTKFALLIVGSSVTTFLVKGAVNFEIGIPLAIGCAIGGLAGALLARRGGDKLIRTLFVVSTVLLTIKLGYDVLR